MIDAEPHRPSRAGRGVLSAYLAVLLYASLSPFFGWSSPLTFTVLTWPKYWTFFDTLVNILAYFPFGVLLANAARHADRPVAPSWLVGRATLLAGAFSVAMELLQAYLPGRASSPLDVLTNTAGALLGALLVVLPAVRGWLHGIAQWRRRHFD